MPDDVRNRLQELESSHLATGARRRWSWLLIFGGKRHLCFERATVLGPAEGHLGLRCQRGEKGDEAPLLGDEVALGEAELQLIKQRLQAVRGDLRSRLCLAR